MSRSRKKTPYYYEMDEEGGGEEENKKSKKCCSFETLCHERAQWWFNVGVAIMVVCGIAGIVGFSVSVAFANRTRDATTQQKYAVSHTMFARPLNHVLTGNAIVTLTLPNDLTAYIGSHYTVDCETGSAHQVVITSGPNPTFWDPVSMDRTATCTGGASSRSGFSFRVISKSHIRVTENSNVAFSA